MKHFIIIFTLFNVTLGYSQNRFTNDQFLYNSGSTDKAESFEESMRTPMMYKQRADENYEKLRTLRKELYRIKEGIQFNKDKYYPNIENTINIITKVLTNSNTNFAHPGVDKVIKAVNVFMDDIINEYNEDIRKYNEKQKYN